MDTLDDIPTEIQDVTNIVVMDEQFFFQIVGHTYGANHLFMLQDELPCGDFKLDDPDGNRYRSVELKGMTVKLERVRMSRLCLRCRC